MSWFPIFGAGFLAGWWMCVATWPRDRPQGEPPLRLQRTVQGLNWPATIGDFTLMGPVNNKGAWRWYERHHNGTIERIKVDHQLRPIYQ